VSEPFQFFTERRLIVLTGLRASTLEELLELTREVPGSCIFYHTHQAYLARHFQRPVFTNDFAAWVGEALQEKALSEQLEAVDLLEHLTVRSLRNELVAHMEAHLQRNGSAGHACPPGEQFYFCRSKSFIMPTGLVAHDPPELFRLLPRVTTASLFYHFFEARLRLGRPSNDFTCWLASQAEEDLGKAIESLNPYEETLDQFKDQILALGRKRFGESQG
jgi:hypothetical protein